MKLLMVTVLGIAGLASLFYFCDPLRDKVAGVLLGTPQAEVSQEKPVVRSLAPAAAAEAPAGPAADDSAAAL